jgi:YD repeat-containing protein
LTAYDALGRVISRTDAKGLVSQYAYDALGRLASVKDALNQLTQYTYDEVGNRLTQTDANGHTTSYAYDQRGRRTLRILPLGQSESSTYDAAGNLQTRTDFNGKTTTYTYDAANRILSKTPDPSFNAPVVTYAYSNGLRTQMTDASGRTYYDYGSHGWLQDVYRPTGSLSYGYDKVGNVTLLSGVYSSTLQYTYDALNRLASVTDAATGTTAYAYDNVGTCSQRLCRMESFQAYSYDARNRLTNLGVNGKVNGAPGPILSYAYMLDASGHRTAVTELSGRTVNYSYDNLYRLTNETIAGDLNGVNGSASYAYDPVGNRTHKTSTLPGYPGTTTNYNANDELAMPTETLRHRLGSAIRMTSKTI